MFYFYCKNISCIAFFLSIFLLVHSNNQTDTKEEEGVLFGETKRVPIILKLLNETTKQIMDLHFSMDEKALIENNYTIKDINQRLIRKTSNGSYEIVISDNQTFPIALATEQIINFIPRNGNTTFQLSTYGLMTKTVEDLNEDPSLQSVNLSSVSWPTPNVCEEMKLNISVVPNGLTVFLNNQSIINKILFKENDSSYSWYENHGLVLAVINTGSCRVTLLQFFQTIDFGFYRDAIWSLDTISPGRLIIIMSMGGASVQLRDARDKISDLGSTWAEYFQYRDGWLCAFISRGKFISEILIPNLRGTSTAGSPFTASLDIQKQNTRAEISCYSKWPTGRDWEKRKLFCEAYDGFGRLCDCTNPFVLRTINESLENISQVDHQIPLLISTGNRTRQLYRLIESAGTQEGITRKSFLIFSNQEYEQTRQLLDILGIQILLHKSKLITVLGRIANNLQFGLYQGLKLFPKAKYFIFLEEDLVLAPDFYKYMQHFAPIFELDESIFCVSAFNHLSYPHTGKDPSVVYRVKSYPAYGWMMSRAIIEYVTPKFLPDKIDQDWDFFIGSELISRKMETLVPDINRSYHWAIGGVHNKGSLLAEELYLSRTLTNHTNVQYGPLKNLIKKTYEKQFVKEIEFAETLRVNDDATNFTTPLQTGKFYKLFVRKRNNSDTVGFQLIGHMLGIWYMDERDHHNHAWKLTYNDAVLFVIGYPISPYTKFMERNGTYVNPREESYLQYHYDDTYANINISTHFNNYYLPKF